VNYFGYIESRNFSGEVITSVLADKIKNTSAMAYGNRYIVLGSTLGFLSIFDSTSFLYDYQIEAHSTKVRCIEFVQDDRHILSGADDKIIKLFHIMATKGIMERTYCGHKGAIHSISIDPSSAGQRFASCSSDNSIIVWNFVTGEKTCIFDCSSSMENDVIRCAVFSPGGNLLAAGTEEATILVFEVPFPSSVLEGENADTTEIIMDSSVPSRTFGSEDILEESQQSVDQECEDIFDQSRLSADQESQEFRENEQDYIY